MPGDADSYAFSVSWVERVLVISLQNKLIIRLAKSQECQPLDVLLLFPSIFILAVRRQLHRSEA